MKALLLFFLAVASVHGTEVHLFNFTGNAIVFQGDTEELLLPVGETVFDWPDGATVFIGADAPSVASYDLSDEGKTVVVVGKSKLDGSLVVTVAGQKSARWYFASAFAIVLGACAVGVLLRLPSKVTTHVPDI